MAEKPESESLVVKLGETKSDFQKINVSSECEEYFAWEAPLDTPSLELRYELPFSLGQMMVAFRSMVFESEKSLPQQLKKLNKFYSRQLLSSSMGKTRESLSYKSVLLPLMNEQELAQEIEKNKSGATQEITAETDDKTEPKTEPKPEPTAEEKEDTTAAEGGWSSWTSLSSWGNWAASFGDYSAWAKSINVWAKMMGMLLEATENWKIDWAENQATAVVTNVTGRWTVGVDEQCFIIESSTASSTEDTTEKNKCVFIKRLYVNPIVTLPQFCIDAMTAKYQEDSDVQVEVIAELIQNPIEE